MRVLQSFLRHSRFEQKVRLGAPRLAASPLVEFASKSKSTVTKFEVRKFSSQSQTNLLDILAREYDEEVDTGNTQMPEDLADLKTSLEATWRMVDEGATTQLFLNEKKVQVSFHCQDTLEEVLDGESEENGDDEEPILPVRFSVTVSKAGKKMEFDCLSEFGQTKIVGVKTSPMEADDDIVYQGPDYEELAEDLQDAFSVYLVEDCAVNSDVATFVAMYADYKEQMQYVQFLKDAKAIIE